MQLFGVNRILVSLIRLESIGFWFYSIRLNLKWLNSSHFNSLHVSSIQVIDLYYSCIQYDYLFMFGSRHVQMANRA